MSAEEAPEVPEDIPKEGDILLGKFRIDRVLGQGGMGVVVAAHHTTLRQKVAIKFLLPSAAKRGDSTERFLREARAAVSIQSEHVARVSDVGTLETGSPYMVMEFLTGADLGKTLEDRGPLPINEAIDYVLQACEAIAEAHALGLIHRDLKPANLFLTSRADGSPLVKVLDFGLSKATAKSEKMDASITAAHVVMGSPCYMSPEQIRSFKSIDARADIWSIGVILFQLLTGYCPFQAESLGALFMAIGSDPVPSMRALRPEIPEELEAAITKCMEKDLKRRTQTIAELARSIAQFGGEDSHISVERIARVLSDSTPFTRASRNPSKDAPAAAPTGTAKPVSAIEGAKTEIQFEATKERAKPAIAAKSLAMSAMAVSDSNVAAKNAAPEKSRRGVVIGAVAAVVVVIAVVAVRFMSGGGNDNANNPSTQATTPPAVKTTTAPSAAGPVVTPMAPATAPEVTSAAPAFSASAATATTATTSPAAGTKSTAPPAKPTASTKFSTPVSAALKHEEKFD